MILKNLGRSIRGRWPIEVRDPPAEMASRALGRFAMLVREARPTGELRIALVYLAHRLSGAARAELLIAPSPGCRPLVVARWPAQDDGQVRSDLPPLQLPLRVQGTSCGVLRLVPGRDRGRVAAPLSPARDGLHALAALAAAAELAHRPDLAGRQTRVPAANPFRFEGDDEPTPRC
jgi:hypothetical protein